MQSKQVILSVPLFCLFAICRDLCVKYLMFSVIEGTLQDDLGDNTCSSIFRLLVVCLPLKGLLDASSAIVSNNPHNDPDIK